MRRELNIVLLGNGFTNWGGGIDFLRLCANSLALICKGSSAKIYVLLPDPSRSPVLKARAVLSPYKQMVIAMLNRRKPVFVASKSFSKIQLTDSFLNIQGDVELLYYSPRTDLVSVCSSIHANVIIPSMYPFDTSFSIPWVGYLYDFQHKYYPSFFSHEEVKWRDSHFSRMIHEARAVIVNSADVKKDINKVYGQTKCQVFNLPFAAAPIETWFEQVSKDFAQNYNLPDKYFAICNQFWIHKDHETAFRALAKVVEITGRQDVNIVCTGDVLDYRCTGHFANLNNVVSQLGLAERIHYLGHIPKKDQIDIMCGSIAVIQPTLFEGGPGGGQLYDAIGMGLPAIVSDIPVNRELEPLGYDCLFFFKAGDADDLAARMIEVEHMVFSKKSKEELLSAGNERTRAFGLRLLEAVEYVMQKKS